MFILNWPLVLVTTAVLYVLMLITLPFSSAYATVFLFGLISFWSRLPGVGLPLPISLPFYVADVVDIFSVIVSINLGGVVGGIFSLFCNFHGRLCGSYPEWNAVIPDFLSQFLACLVLPFFHAFFGGNIFYSVVVYTILRLIFLIPLDQIFYFYTVSFFRYVTEGVVGAILLFMVNAFYSKLFGNFISNLLQAGVSFNWMLFLIVTVIIIVFYVSVFGKSKTVSSAPAIEGLKKTLKFALSAKKKKKLSNSRVVSRGEVSDIDEIKRNI